MSKEVYDGFVTAIKDRDARSETIKSSFVGIGKADIIQAEMKGSEANITMRIASQLITATYDKDGNVIDGDPDSVGEVNDVWTFAPRHPLARPELEADRDRIGRLIGNPHDRQAYSGVVRGPAGLALRRSDRRLDRTAGLRPPRERR